MDAARIIARLESPAGDEQATLDELRATAPVQALIEAFASAQDPWTRMLLADLLGDRADPAALEPLVAALDDPDERVRWSVADALRKLFDSGRAPGGVAARRAGAALLARYEVEQAPEVARPLVCALGAVGHAAAVPALRAALASEDPALVFVARGALHRLDGAPPVSAQEIVELLERPVEDGRALTGRLLAGAPTAVLAEALERARDPSTRRVLADLLGFRADAAALDPLLAALDDPDPHVRAAVADALGKVAMADPPPPASALHRAGAAMLAGFESEPSPAVRRTLASAVGAARYLPALPVLRRALASDDPSLVFSARWGLHWLEGTPPPD